MPEDHGPWPPDLLLSSLLILYLGSPLILNFLLQSKFGIYVLSIRAEHGNKMRDFQSYMSGIPLFTCSASLFEPLSENVLQKPKSRLKE